MLISIKRSEIHDLISQKLINKKKVIVTGLDGSGKSTILKEFFPVCNLLKTNATTTRYYFCGHNFEFMIDEYDLFDRHPIIDGLVYHYSSLMESHDATIDDMIKKFYDRNTYYSYYDTIIILLNDKFVGNTHQNKWISILRPYIIECYKKCAELFSEYGINVYIVED